METAVVDRADVVVIQLQSDCEGWDVWKVNESCRLTAHRMLRAQAGFWADVVSGSMVKD